MVSGDVRATILVMVREDISLEKQATVLSRIEPATIAESLAASLDPASRAVGAVMQRVQNGGFATIADVKQALQGTDHDTMMSYLLAYDRVEKAARTDALSGGLAELARDPNVANAFDDMASVPVKDIQITSPRVALLIGVSNYSQPLSPLQTPIADVAAVGDVLANRFGYQTFVVRDPGKQDIVSWVASIGAQLKEDSNFLVYYAGHGYSVESTGQGYWLPADAGSKSASNWISTRDLSDYLSRVKAKQMMLVSDSCYSGSLTKEMRLSSDVTSSGRDQIFQRRAVMAMSSGGEQPVFDGGYGGHSVFAGNLIKTLSEAKRDDVGFNLFNQVRTGVTKAAYAADPLSALRRV